MFDSRELRRFVVRVEDGQGKILGTGFYAAPGWVVTCAHVVSDLAESPFGSPSRAQRSRIA